MPGLLSTLDLGARSLQTQQQGVQVAGHNIANANNAGYARQRLRVQSAPATDSQLGDMGNGVQSVAITQMRNVLLDRQIVSQNSISSYLTAQQSALQYAEANLGQDINTQGSAATGSDGTQYTLASGLNDLFNAFQSVSTDPASLSERSVLLNTAADLAARFNQTDQRLGTLREQINASIETDAANANNLLAQIAGLNERIARAESRNPGSANDLIDQRQEKLEDLSKLVKIDVVSDDSNTVDVSIGGVTFVSGRQVADTLETYDAGGGQLLLRAATSGTALTVTGGSLAGSIDTRDGELAALRDSIDTLASSLIRQVNTIHRGGYNLKGGTGADFFTGTGAADIQVNQALIEDPALLQAAGTSNGAGDNRTVLALAQLGDQDIADLDNQTFSQRYNQTVTVLGQALSTVESNIADQDCIKTLLSNQRDSVSGVSLDEEMTDLMKYQKAFQASARLVSIVDQMMDTVLSMKQ